MKIRHRLSAAIGGFMSGLRFGFPDVAEYLQYQPWPFPQEALEFPKAAALVPTIYACVTRISNDLAQLQPTFYKGVAAKRRKIERKPGNIVDLWTKANPDQTGHEMERDRQYALDINGNSYLYLERFGVKGAEPGELWVMPGHLVRPVAGPRRSVVHYEFGMYRSGIKIAPEDVIPFRYANPDWNPLEPAPIGLSPLQACQMAYETRHGMSQWQREFYRRGGAVAHVFSVKDGAGSTEADIKARQEYMDRRFMGLRNAFKPVFVRGVEVARAGLTQQEMQYLETARLTDGDICRVFQIPPADMGIQEHQSSLSQGAGADRSLAYWQNCITPRVQLRDRVLNERLCPLFGDDIFCDTDFSAVLPIQEARLSQAKAMVILCGRPIFSVNEVRERLDSQPSDDPTADDLYVRQNPLGTIPDAQPDPNDTSEPGAAATPPKKAPKPPAAEQRRQLVRQVQLVDRKKRGSADLARYERRVARAFEGRFDAQLTKALARLEHQAHHAGMPLDAARRGRVRLSIDGDGLVDPADDQDAAELQSVFEQLIADRGEAAAAEVAMEIALDVTTAAWQTKIGERVDRMIALTDETTRSLLRKSLGEGLDAGDSYSKLVERVRQVFSDRRDNATTIARTETAWAYNAAAFDVWKQGGVEMKEWLTAGDEAVRDAHAATEAAGPIPMDEPFDVGGFPAMFPGETGVPELDINCRCIVQPYFAESGDLDFLFEPAGRHAKLDRVLEEILG